MLKQPGAFMASTDLNTKGSQIDEIDANTVEDSHWELVWDCCCS